MSGHIHVIVPTSMWIKPLRNGCSQLWPSLSDKIIFTSLAHMLERSISKGVKACLSLCLPWEPFDSHWFLVGKTGGMGGFGLALDDSGVDESGPGLPKGDDFSLASWEAWGSWVDAVGLWFSVRPTTRWGRSLVWILTLSIFIASSLFFHFHVVTSKLIKLGYTCNNANIQTK